jgi:hypothetical protein
VFGNRQHTAAVLALGIKAKEKGGVHVLFNKDVYDIINYIEYSIDSIM